MENEEVIVETENQQEETETPEENKIPKAPEKDYKQMFEDQKRRAEKAELDRKAYEAKLNSLNKGEPKTLDVVDYIDISASLEGLDQREKEKLAQEHKLTGKSLKELREAEDFKLWQSAYREKVEKEKQVIPPSGTQPEGEKPKSLNEKLAGASIQEKEKILTEMGLYKSPRQRTDRVEIKMR